MAKDTGRVEPDLHAIEVPADKWAHLDGTGLEYAHIGDSDDYAVRDKGQPETQIRRPGDDFRKLGAVLGRGAGTEQTSGAGLHEIDVDEDRYELIEGTRLEYARINDHDDAYSVRDIEHEGDIRRPGDDWRKLGTVL
ncbi:hypothetical protein [Nonomuraea gerenzanensis]|uniref:Uncharacterized protein n=1 Tax=Nonomuraea gerenzanensis TaxID=93944 RepID=A0A1M4EMK8_9ACTN|nr:hypothetical protein [Nonomuraea gerenzanensis]UBU11586.1 hypothetical protein LCN96_45985 [Nonomuraea gerenzanensis]SBP00081.1 hypothetical protein BN4615_P9597 [Nonomuraea gerenzanensis]